jgi:hypothetical protein
MRRLQIDPLPAHDPEIGRWLWALEEVRDRTLRLVAGLDQRMLDWEGPDGRENAIGSLLYHIALTEMEWLFLDVLGQDLPTSLRNDFPYPAEDAQGRHSRVVGMPLGSHLTRMRQSRGILLNECREISPAEWRRPRLPIGEDYEVTPEWVIFHLVEHEAGHAFQISSLKARVSRLFTL